MHVVSPESDDLDGYSFQESTQWRVVLLWAAWRLTFACDRCDSAAQEYRVSFVRGFRGALPNCQISDLGSDSDTLSNSNSALWAMSRTFSFSITFAQNLGIYVGIWQEKQRWDCPSEHKRRRHSPRDMLHRHRYIGSCSLIIG